MTAILFLLAAVVTTIVMVPIQSRMRSGGSGSESRFLAASKEFSERREVTLTHGIFWSRVWPSRSLKISSSGIGLNGSLYDWRDITGPFVVKLVGKREIPTIAFSVMVPNRHFQKAGLRHLFFNRTDRKRKVNRAFSAGYGMGQDRLAVLLNRSREKAIEHHLDDSW